ncbi:MAG: hypothetical protein AAF958_05975 [Planctomycetota bacterium]
MLLALSLGTLYQTGKADQPEMPLVVEASLDLDDRFEQLLRTRSASTKTGENTITLGGVIQDRQGNPVDDAIVVLWDDLNQRFQTRVSKGETWQEAGKRPYRLITAVAKVDPKGRYQITAPIPSRWTGQPQKNSLGNDIKPGGVWTLLAKSRSAGFGWQKLQVLPKDASAVSGSKIASDWKIVGKTDLALQPTTIVRGRYQTEQGEPIENAEVRFGRLEAGRLSSWDDLSFFGSLPFAKILTDANGAFEIRGIPIESVLEVYVIADGYQGSAAQVLTDDSERLARRESRRNRINPQPNPAVIIADPGVRIEGIVTGPDGEPIADAKIAFTTGPAHTVSDTNGRYELVVSTEFRDRTIVYPNPTDLRAEVKRDGARIQQVKTVQWDRNTRSVKANIAFDPVTIVSGTVRTADGDPIANAMVRTLHPDHKIASRVPSISGEDGSFTIALRVGKQRVFAYGADRSYDWPDQRTGIFANDPLRAVGFPGADVEIVANKKVEPLEIIVPRRKPRRVSVQLPGGEPAAGAVAVIRVPRSISRPGQPSPNGISFENIGEPIALSPSGEFSFTPDPSWNPGARVDVSLIRGDKPYLVQIPVDAIDEASPAFTMIPACEVTGLIRIDGAPATGVRLLIDENKGSQPMRVGGGVAYRVVTGDRLWTETGPDGRYRTIVPRDGSYTVGSFNFPGENVGIGRGFGAQKVSESRHEAATLDLYRGDAQIVGKVVDQNDQPIEGLRVSLADSRRGGTNGVESYQFLGHAYASDRETNADGEFVLRKLLEGKYDLQFAPAIGTIPTSSIIVRKNIPTGSKPVVIRLEVNRPFGATNK